MTTTSPFPLSPAQRSIHDAFRLDPDSPVFVVADVVEIDGPIDLDALTSAIGATVAEADALWLRIEEGADRSAQTWCERRALDPAVRDLRTLPDPDAVARAWIEDDLARGDHDLGHDHVVFRLADERTWWYQRYHHVHVDGYAVAAISRRVAHRYRAALQGAEPTPGFGRLVDLWAEEESFAASDAARDAQAWFTELLDPTDGAPAPFTSLTGSISAASRRPIRQEVRLDPAAHAAVDAITARDRRLTWADVHLTLFAAYVGRATGQEDVVIALPVSSRVTPLAARTPSMSVNVLPVRLSVPRGASVLDLAVGHAAVLSRVRRHQRVRGEMLAAHRTVPGGSALLRGPAINIKPFAGELDLGDATGRLRNLQAGPVDDLDLTITPGVDGELELVLEANPDLHHLTDLRRHVEAFATFAAGVLARPEAAIASVALVRGADDPVPSRAVEAVDVSDRFVATAARLPDEVAVRCGTDSVTYRELLDRVRAWASALRGDGVGPDDVVAIGLERGVDVVTAILAVLEAGAAYLPVDLAYPQDRIDYLLADAKPSIVLTRADTVLAGDPRARLVTDHGLAGGSTSPSAVARRPGSLAYVVHTSGSTGQPKGVMVSRGSLAFFTSHHVDGLFADVAAVAGRRLRAAHTASFSFDSSWEQLTWLVAGHELVVYDEDDRRDAYELVTAVARDRIDTLDVTPSMAVALLDQGLLDCGYVPRLFLIGGEAASDELWRTLAASAMASHNFYGPTEGTVDALGAPVEGSRATIGRPLTGTAARVLDTALQPVPAGATGELYLAGPHLARGYAGRPALTATRFVADPHGAPGERMYRTGDLVRVEPDGSTSYLGREDDQVKIRGHRIELGEVVAALESLAAVHQAHVGVTSEPVRLVAHVVAPGVDVEALRDELGRSLPDHLVPAVIVALDAFPQTAHGKLDVAALPAPTWSSSDLVAPRDERETAVCAAMAAALGLEAVSVADDFFVLGGDSISAITVAGRVRAAGWQMRPRDLFAARTARTLARDLVPVVADEDSAALDDPTGPVHATPVMAEALALVDAVADFDRYAQYVTLRLPDGLTDERLAAVMAALIERHPTLRLHLSPRAGESLWIPEAGPDPVLVSAADHARAVDAALASLDPRAGIVVAAARVRQADGLVVVAAHHLAVDGVSWRVLLADLEVLLAGGDVPTATSASWRSHTFAVERAATSGHFRPELEHWTRITAVDDIGARLAPRADDTVGGARRSTVRLDDVTSRAVLEQLPIRFDCRADAVVAGLLALAIDRWARQDADCTADSLLFTWETHGREPVVAGEDLSATVGWFTEEFPVAVSSRALDGGVASAIKAAHQARLEVPGEGTGFGALAHLDPVGQAALEGAARPSVLVNYLGRFGGAGTGLLVGDDPFTTHVPSALRLAHGIEVNVFATDAGATVEWTVAGSLAAQAREIRACLDTVLAEAVAEASGPLRGTLVPAQCSLPGVDQTAIDLAESDLGRLRDVAPLTPLQEGLLFHALADGDDDVYTTLTTIRLTTDAGVDPARVRRAVQALVERHPQLAARFSADRFGRPAQLIALSPASAVDVVDLSGRRTTLTAELGRLRTAALAEPFDVTAGPLVRFTLVRHDDGADLLLAAHHLVADGWSTPLLVDDLLRAHAGESLGDPAAGYVPFRRYLTLVAADDAAANRGTWAAYLGGVTAPTRVGAGAPVGTTTAVPVPLPTAVGTGLAAQLRAGGVTLGAALSAAWAFALGRHVGTPDVVFGTTVAGRTAAVEGIETVIGLLSQTVPVRVDARADETWRGLLGRVQAESAALQDVERTSLADIEEACGVTGLFDTLVVVENYPTVELPERGGLRLEGIDNVGATHYPLALTALPGAGVELVVDADLGRVDRAAVDAIVADVVAALTSMAEDLSSRPSSVDVGEPRALRGSAPQQTPDAVSSFLAAVAEHPDAPAVLSAAGDMTFAELAAQAAGILEQLDALGLRAGDLVALALARTPAAAAAIIACLAGGYGYVPVDIGYPVERLRQTVADAAPSAVITDRDRWDVAPGLRVVVPTAAVPATALRRRPVDDRSVAYVIYTSGSTGRPKGVVIERGAMTRHFHGLRAQRETEVVDVVRRRTGREQVRALVSASLSFDTSLGQLHWLFAGHTIVLLDEDERRDPAVIAQTIEQRQVDVADLAPVLAEQLLDHDVFDGPRALTLLYLGGEAVPPSLWTRLRRVSTPTINLYGPTESTVDALGARVDAGPLPSIGSPVSGVVAYVLDPWLRAVPAGTAGELYLAGSQLARGYLGRPGLTAERFVAHPWGAPGERLYRTGDMVRADASGQLAFVGRVDDQVKIGGHRIELGEITALVTAFEGVAAAAVLADPPGATAHRLVAFVVRSTGWGTDEAFVAQLRADLLERAPAHLVPSAIVVLDELPMTVNDKVDRLRLRGLDVPASTSGPARVPASSPAELVLAAALSELLGVPEPSMDDDFFALGGHSLTALRVLGALRSEGWALGVRDVFDGRELGAIASRAVRVSRSPASRSETGRLAHLVREGGTAGVGDAQRRLLFLAELEGAASTYNVPVTHLVEGPVDTDLLTAAWDTIVGRHAALRTRFESADGTFGSVVLPSHDVPGLAVLEVDDLDAAVAAQEGRVFDVFAQPPVSLTLLRSDVGQALVLCAHHVVIDDWSIGIVTAELSTLMHGGVLPAQPDESQDVARHVISGRGDVDPGDAAFWRGALDGLPAELELPHDRPRGDRPSYRAHVHSLAIDGELRDLLQAACARSGASPLMVLQTAVATFARGLGAGTDVCLGMPVTRRDDPADAMTVGYLLNTLPVRLDVSGSGSLLDQVTRTRAAVLDALDHGATAFERIVEIVAPPRSLARHPLFQVMVSHEDGGGVALKLPGATVTPYPARHDAARVDLAVRLVETSGQPPRLDVTGAADLFDETTVTILARRLARWLGRVLSSPDTSLAGLDVLLDDERPRAIADHARRVTPPPSVPARIAARVRQDPDRLAVVAADGQLSYAALADRAATIVDVLRQHGVGRDDLVAIAVPRTTDLVVSLVGVLGARAAYLPLDAAYPAERLQDMLDDAAPVVVLVTPETAGIGRGLPEIDVRALHAVSPPADAVTVLDVSSGLHSAYTIYTSGSTGRPKGVIVPAAAMAAFVDQVDRDLQLVATDRFVAVTTISFDIAVLEIFVPLVSGAAVVLAGDEQVRDPDLLVELADRAGATHLQATPSLWRPLLDAHPQAFADVVALVGGEALPPDLADTLVGSCRAVTNEYGPTEATVWATRSDVVAARDAGETVTIGRPYLDVGVLVLDDQLRPVPDGVAGELYLAGEQLARGYHDRFALTAERFVASPLGRPGERMYRTGDLVRRDAAGRLRFVRRVDDQVKVLGHRIELGEVESHLGRLPGVRVAAATTRSDAAGTARLVGYVVAEDGALDPFGLRTTLAERVPAQFIPQQIVQLDALPLTLNGKIDRAKLPEPVTLTTDVGRAPSGPAEEIVCRAVAEVLELGSVGPDHAFFELGGDSISSIRLVSVARGQGLHLTPRDVFVHPTLAALAAAGRLEAVPTAASRPGRRDRRTPRSRVALGADDLARINSQLGRNR